jgi:hypothetical protein
MGFVTVKVEGDDKDQVNGVAAGVMVGLESTGFKNVKLAVEYEAKDMEAVINRDRSLDAPSTLLASLRMRNPDLFDQPVMVHVPVVKPSGGLTVFQTSDNRILEEKDDYVPHPRTQDDTLHTGVIQTVARALDDGKQAGLGDTRCTLELEGQVYQFDPDDVMPDSNAQDFSLVADKSTPSNRVSHGARAEIEASADAIESGMRHPYDGRNDLDATPARAAALGILNDLTGRGGVGDELDCLDDGLREEITQRLTNIIHTSFEQTNTAELYNAVQGLVEKGVMSKERAAGFLHSMNTLAQH